MTQPNQARRYVLAVADQAAFAAANFILTLLLARWLAPEEFGALSLVLSVHRFAIVTHGALVAEPVLLFGSTAGTGRKEVLRGALALNLVVTVLLTGLSWFVVSTISVGVEVEGYSSVLLVITPVVLLAWFFRRYAYALLQPSVAALSGVTYLAALLISLGLARFMGDLVGPQALTSMGIASSAAVLVIILQLSPRQAAHSKGRPPLAGTEVGRRFDPAAYLKYGFGNLLVAHLYWVNNNVYYFILPVVMSSIESAGDFRIVVYSVMPFTQAISAVASLLLPSMAHSGATRGHYVSSGMFRAACLPLVGLGVLWLAFVLFGPNVVGLTFGRDEVGTLDTAVQIIGGVPLFAGVAWFAASGVRAHGKPAHLALPMFVAAAFSTTAALLLGGPLGLTAGAIGLLGSNIVMAAGNSAALLRLERGKRVGRTGSASVEQ